MAESLIKQLQTVPDFRRSQGRRFNVEQMLMMIIFGIMSGCYGYRELSTFMRSNTKALKKYLGINAARMPSHVSVRTFINNIDFTAVNAVFAAWASQRLKIAPGELLSIDGKALKSTLSDTYSSQQDFIAIVSLYCQRQHAVVSLARYHNGQTSEITTVEQLIAAVDFSGAIITADALHCQKKHSKRSSQPAMTTSSRSRATAGSSTAK